jgi:hypothetical protein
MAVMPGAELGIRIVLGALACYHLGIGAVSALSLGSTTHVVRKLYGLHLQESPAFRYATKMLGLFALVFGGLLANAALNPSAHRAEILAIIVLQTLRGAFRLWHRDLLAEAFAVTRRENGMAVMLLALEVTLLVAWFPSP